jgi:serine/threonine-protein kinase
MMRIPYPLGLAVLFASGAAFAQPTPADVTAAQTLFDDAKELMKVGRYDEACRKLEESERLDRGGGTLVALALCYEAQGKLGSAWTEWNLALSDARSAHRADRESMAREHVHALEQRMPRLRVVIAARASGLEVRQDGVRVPDALWGTAVPVDPGQHRLEASAPGRRAWSASVNVAQGPSTVDVSVPDLPPSSLVSPPPPIGASSSSSVPAPAEPAPPASAASPASAESPASPSPPAAPNPTRTWAFVVGGAAVASLAVGAAFGLSANSKWNDARTSCPTGVCADRGAVDQSNDAAQAADMSTAFFAVGGAAALASAVLFVVSTRQGGGTGGATGGGTSAGCRDPDVRRDQRRRPAGRSLMRGRRRVECAALRPTSALASVAVLLLLGGCRQALGIEPFELADASGDTSLASESGGADAPADIGAKDATGIDAGPADTGPAVDVATPSDDASDDSGDDSGDDAGAVDSGGFQVGPFDASAYAACTNQPASCHDCCTSTYTSAKAELIGRMYNSGCLCGTCINECSATWCANPPETDAGTANICSTCVTLEMVDPMTASCVQSLQDCQNSATCRDAVQCVYACPP